MWFQTRTKASSRDATKMSHAHERIETKWNELVYKRLKVSRVNLPQSSSSDNESHMPTMVLRNQMGQHCLQSSQRSK